MAREPKVTRTIGETVVKLKCADLEQGEIHDTVITLPYSETDGEKALKALKKQYETDNYKLLNVLSTEIIYTRYEMPQSLFISFATPYTLDSDSDSGQDKAPEPHPVDEPHPVNE